ncbi:MAG TPA: hypothetical protein VLB02_01945 [Candidatus Paceibacterota bacterium]|nr:hypothetical protein [Candidatus Paceibacterota bacterium]
MKKIIISMFALFGMLIATPILAHAADRFNTDPNDLPTIMVTNVTQDGGCSAGTGAGCWKTSVDARPGDTVAVQVYFHNATNTIAYDTHLSLQPGETSRGTTHTFSGGVASSSIDRATGSATVRTSSTQKLTFINGSVRVFRHGDQVGFSVDNENSLFGTGLSIDEVGVGVQGVLMAKFKVSNDAVTDDDNCRITDFTADDYTIDEDESTRLRWDTTDCDYVKISHISGNLDTDGSVSVSPNEDTKYILTAYPGGDTEDLTIRVNEDSNNNNCDISFYADRTSITRGQSTKLHWDVSDGNDIDISNLDSNVNESGSKTVSPNSTTTYRLTVNGGDCDNESKSVTIRVEDGASTAKPQAITNPATLVAATAAKLNGIAIPNANVNTSAWFEWGPTPALGAATAAQGVGSAGSLAYSYTVGSLMPNTTYYFRAVVQNANGVGLGETLSFRTGATVTNTTRVVRSTRVVSSAVTARSTASLLELSVENAYDRMCAGGEIEYIVTYKNISRSTLVDAVLQVTHPKQLVFVDATRGDYSASERKLTVDLGQLAAGEEGSIRVRGRVTDNSVVGDLIVTTATVVYTNPTTRAQEDAIAYSLTTVSDDCPNGFGAASLFGSGSFLPDTLIEWLLLILVILALMLLGRNLYNKKASA